MNACLLLPTLNRTRLLERFISSYIETRSIIPTMVLVDNEDFKKNEHAYLELSDKMPQSMKIKLTKDAVTMGDKVRFIFDEIKDFRWVGLLNDDHYLITSEWDKRADELIDGTNMVSTNDGSWNFGFNVVGLTAWSMPIIKAAQFPIFPKEIDHWFIDNIWKAIGESTGCWLETMKVNIEHRHVFIGKMELDETAKLSQDQELAKKSSQAFERFMNEDFKGVCERIIKLRETQINQAKFT